MGVCLDWFLDVRHLRKLIGWVLIGVLCGSR